MKVPCIKVACLATLSASVLYLATDLASGQQFAPSAQPSAAFPRLPSTAYDPTAPTTDPETDKLRDQESKAERDVAKLVNEYSRAEGESARAKIKASLSAALEKEFDLQQKRRDLELAAVEARVKKVRELMQKRADARQSIIEERAKQLTREADGLGWTAPPGVNLPNLPANRGQYSNGLQAR
jgi:hypothetical protein